LKTIYLAKKKWAEGLDTLVRVGTVVWTGRWHVYRVPDESLKVLKQKHIPFHVVKNKPLPFIRPAGEENLVICIDDRGYEASLERNKIYQQIPDEEALRDHSIRVIDDSGEDYLYSIRRFTDAGIKMARFPKKRKHRYELICERVLRERALKGGGPKE